MALEYVLITPARNESAFIEKTIQSVIGQTMLPKRWVIVSDGSTDGTDEIVQNYSGDREWMELIRLPERKERNFAAKVQAFNAGYDRVKALSFDVIGCLDADITFAEDYLAYLLEKFEAISDLGVAGTHYTEGNFHSYDDSYINVNHVNGGCQLFKRECFEEIGGYVPIKGGGVDWVAVTTARMKGWTTYSFAERTFCHHRKIGTASNNELMSRFNYGKKDYFLGGHPFWQVFRGIFQMTKKPYVIGGLALMFGYTWCWATRVERSVSDDLMNFHRKEQLERLKQLLSDRASWALSRSVKSAFVANSMTKIIAPSMRSTRRNFTAEILRKGKPARVECVEINGQIFSIQRGLLTSVKIIDEWYEDVEDPHVVVNALKGNIGFMPDIYSFWQRMPDVEPKYKFYQEWEEIAVLPIVSYDHWWNHQIKSRVRNLIRKAEKKGVVVKETSYDDDFVRGMTAIFNETPVRQGRRFWHYGKDFETVKNQFSRYLFREQMIGAYYKGELIGFIMLGDAGRFGITGQIISSLKHRDKAPNNALIAKAVEVCAQRNLDYLVYLFWSNDSLSEFKRRCGFEKVKVPKYYVPLSWKGEFALKCGAHRGWVAMVPNQVKNAFKRVRRVWNTSFARN